MVYQIDSLSYTPCDFDQIIKLKSSFEGTMQCARNGYLYAALRAELVDD